MGYAKIGQIQWICFLLMLVDFRFALVWLISLMMDNKKDKNEY